MPPYSCIGRMWHQGRPFGVFWPLCYLGRDCQTESQLPVFSIVGVEELLSHENKHPPTIIKWSPKYSSTNVETCLRIQGRGASYEQKTFAFLPPSTPSSLLAGQGIFVPTRPEVSSSGHMLLVGSHPNPCVGLLIGSCREEGNMIPI